MRKINLNEAVKEIKIQIDCFIKRTGIEPNAIFLPQDFVIVTPFPHSGNGAEEAFGIPIREYNGAGITVGYIEEVPTKYNFIIMPKNHGRKEAKQQFTEWLKAMNPGAPIGKVEKVESRKDGVTAHCVIFDELHEYKNQYYDVDKWRKLREKAIELREKEIELLYEKGVITLKERINEIRIIHGFSKLNEEAENG